MKLILNIIGNQLSRYYWRAAVESGSSVYDLSAHAEIYTEPRIPVHELKALLTGLSVQDMFTLRFGGDDVSACLIYCENRDDAATKVLSEDLTRIANEHELDFSVNISPYLYR